MISRLRRIALLGPLLLAVPAAQAHTVGISRGEYRVSGSSVRADLVFARPELAAAVPGLDADRDGSVTAADLQASRRALAEAIVRGIEVGSAKGACTGEVVEATITEQDGVALRMAYHCPGAPASTLRLALLESLSLGHRHLAAIVSGESTTTSVLYERNAELRLIASPDPEADGGVAWPLFRLGIQHILTGYDHLLFLFGLILVGGRLRALLVVVTAFTVAHSISLGLAALGIWAPSPRLVEPAIALSIAYVGVENWFVRDAARRWLVTFPFGLIHGFGFAGALREISLPAGQVPLALASFNLGVEAGQLAVLAVVLPMVLWLGHRRWFADRGVKALSAAIALAGLGWFMARLA